MDGHKLTDSQTNILHYLYRFRFLTSIQLSKILNQTIRYTNYHLKVLSEKNFIAKHYNRTLGLANQPAVYYLASGSIKALQDQKDIDNQALKRIYREKNRSQQFIAHASFLADYFLFIRVDSEKSQQILHFFTKTDLLAHPYFIHPLPDAYFARVDKISMTKRYMVEVVEDSSPRFALRKRIEQYCDYIDDGKFTEVTGHDFPTLLFICPGYASLIYLKKHIARIYEETSLDQVDIYLATREGAFSGSWERVEAEDS
ncbi:replication-relaxation family protein [Candidatus Collierbacteria bacterium]|nr:replication-relaxation family protein [Candidatus Collierbacteria bacterium]